MEERAADVTIHPVWSRSSFVPGDTACMDRMCVCDCEYGEAVLGGAESGWGDGIIEETRVTAQSNNTTKVALVVNMDTRNVS